MTRDGGLTHIPIAEASIADLRARMDSGDLSAVRLVQFYSERIVAMDWAGTSVQSVIELNPDAEGVAAARDAERGIRDAGDSLLGIPILIKDNIDTADRMETTAGSLALAGSRPLRDASVVERLRAAGAILLGKANMSEWANFRSTSSSSGWSARGGQCRNPYALDRTPSGSSSGSAAAVAAGFAAASLGSETDGSILSPASACGVVGIKPTVGLTSRAGVIPISATQDTVGVFGRSVADVALVLGAITGVDGRDPATAHSLGHEHSNYERLLDVGALRGARIGVPREVYFSYSRKASRVAENAIQVMRDLGAVIVDPADIPTARAIDETESEFEVLLYEFKAGLNEYLAGRGAVIRTLDDLIEFNSAHADVELRYFDQDILEMAAQRGSLSEPAYQESLKTIHRLAGPDGIDAVMEAHRLDALVLPTGSPAIKIDLVNGGRAYGGSSRAAAIAGYPAISVPAGFVSGLPVGITFIACAWSEAVLLRLAYAFEQGSPAWQAPKFIPST